MTAKSDDQIHEECMQRFIDLANVMKDERIPTKVVSAAMMTACAVYSTYVFAGNDGRLAPTGTAKLASAFKQQLDRVQNAKAASVDKG